LDNLEQHQIIELIEKRIKIWWETPELSYRLDNLQVSPKCYLISTTEYLNNRINNIHPVVDNLLSESKNRESQYQKNLRDLKDLSGKISEIQIKINNLTVENKKLKEEIEQLKEKKSNVSVTASIEDNKRSSVSIPADNTIKIFNDWAREPITRPPSQFTFADGELKLREKQNIKETSNINSLWIINKSGTIKYLFPNPNAIDGIGGDIDPVYTVTGTRKAKGQNRINILKACEIKDGGWIEFKGELSLL